MSEVHTIIVAPWGMDPKPFTTHWSGLVPGFKSWQSPRGTQKVGMLSLQMHLLHVSRSTKVSPWRTENLSPATSYSQRSYTMCEVGEEVDI